MTKALMLALLGLVMIAPARAQVTVDVGKITCNQYLGFKVADPRDIAIWLSGYYHGKTNSMILEPQTLRQNADALKNACFQPGNGDLPVIQVIEKTLINKK